MIGLRQQTQNSSRIEPPHKHAAHAATHSPCRRASALHARGALMLPLQVITHTSNLQNAGTDANVYVDIVGIMGSTGKVPLRSDSIDLFERGQVDKFKVCVSKVQAACSAVPCIAVRGCSCLWGFYMLRHWTPLDLNFWTQDLK